MMSDGINMAFGGLQNDGFTIKTMHGCRLVFGSVPMSEFGMLTNGYSKKALMATDIADLIGASFVIGEPGDLEALRKLDLPVSERRHNDYLAAQRKGLPEVAEWLRNGERGASSNAMCGRLFGVPEQAGKSHPLDPDDLRRCLLMLDAARAHDQIEAMADVSPQWRQLVSEWDRLTLIFHEEMEAGKSALTFMHRCRSAPDDERHYEGVQSPKG